ncbi:protein AHNAK2 isoform X27 [Serinus canaria]|uniref:protein AHNAK2 isoform X27 n=1 Tax=Serinus canaria TaxID=9135 RepID=UPI0021CC9D92|nr:protein AHNAK2 isoform X27 [Serinus canaria]
MEVTLKTEVEAGASGFSVKGGGNEGIFIKKVLKESPASKIFSLREGDQLLSATIFFDNIKYEDALKILQYSEPYRVQFSLKRKIAVQEDLEHSTAQHKKERIGQEKELSESIPEETPHVSGKSISEEDRETLIVSQRVGRSKRPKKDRLSWPKFQSIKNKKILRHRRSHSTSDAYEPALQDISPTSTDTESQFPQEVHTKEKKGSQRKLKFPSIGFRMHRSKPEPQEKQRKEIKTTLISEREKIHQYDISLENPEILTVEYTTSPAYEMKTGEGHETLTKDVKEMKNGIPSHVKQCPEVEISIKKDKEATSKFSVPEVADITTDIPKPSLETADLKVSPTKKSPQASSKSRKKKQKGTADKKDGESGINIDLMGHSTKGSVQVKGLEIGTAKAELQTSETLQTGEKKAEEDTQIINIQKINYGISVPKRKETEADTTKQRSDVPQSVQEKTADMTSEDSRNVTGKTLMPDTESDVSTWKIQMPSFKVAKAPKTDIKITREESKEDTEDRVKKERMEEDAIPTNDKALNIEIGMKRGEKDIEGKESKFRLPKLKFPTFTWSSAKEETAQPEAQISDREVKVQTLEITGEPQVSGPPEKITVPTAETKVVISIGKIDENDTKQKHEGQMLSPKKTNIKSSPVERKTEDTKGKMWISKTDIEIEKMEFNEKSKDELLEMTPPNIKAPEVDISLPSVDVTLPQASVDLQAPEATMSLEGEAKVPEKEAAKTKDGKFKMPKFGMPSFGWSSSREAKGTVAAEVDVSPPEPQVTVPSGATEVEVTLPAAEIQAPGVEVTIETATVEAGGEKGGFKMPDVKMPSIKLPKMKAPQAQVSLPKAEVSLPKAPEGDVALQGPEAEGSLEVAAGKAEGGGMKIHMPKVKVPSVVFSKPTLKSPKLEADISLPQAELKAPDSDITVTAPDDKLPSVEGSLELQAPDVDLKAPSAEGKLELEGTGLKGKLKMPKFDKPKFKVSSPKGEVPTAEVSLPSAEVELPSATVTAAGEGIGVKLEKPSLKMPKADIKAPKVDISMPSVDVTLPQASVDLQAPESTMSLEGEAKVPEKEAAKAKDGKFKMPKFGMPSFGWSSSREAKGTVAAEVDVSLPEPQVTVPSCVTEVEVTLPGAEIQAPGVEVTIETATVAAESEKGGFKMPDVKMPSIKLPKMKAPQAQVSLPKAEVSLPKAPEGEVALQGPEAEGSLEVAAGKVDVGGMKIHMPKVKVPSVVFSKPTLKSPNLEADISLPQAELKATDSDITVTAPDAKLPSVEGSLELQAPDVDLKAPSAEGKLELGGTGLKGKLKMPKFDKPKFKVSSPKGEVPTAEAEVELPSATMTAAGESTSVKLEKPSLKMPKADIKAPKVDISMPSVDVTLPQASVDLQAPEATMSLEGEAKVPEKEATKTKDGKLKMPKFDKPKFKVSSPKGEVPTAEVSLPSAEVELPCATVTATVEGTGVKVEKSSLNIPKADIKAPKVDISLPSVDVTLPQASVDLQAPEATMSLEGEAKVPEKEAAKAKDGKFKMPKFGMPSFGWSSSREAKGTAAAEVDISLHEPQVTVPSRATEVEVTLPTAEIQAPGVEVTIETATVAAESEKGRFKMPDVKMPSVKLPKMKAPQAQVSLPKAEVSLPKASEGEVARQGPEAEGSLEVAAGKAEGGGMKIHMPKVKVPSVVFSKPTVKSPKLEADISLPQAELKASDSDITVTAPDVKLPSVEGSLELQAPDVDLKAPSAEGKLELEGTGLKGKLKMPKFDKPKFKVSSPKGEVPTAEAEVELPSATVMVAGESTSVKLEKPSLKMPKADIKAPEVDISMPSVDVTLPQASVDLQAPEATMSLEGEAKVPENEAAKTKDGKFKMPKFGMPSFGWSSSREAKGTAAAEVDVSLPEPQVTVPSGSAITDVTFSDSEIQAPSFDAPLDSSCGKGEDIGKSKTSVFRMPKISLSKTFKPHAQSQSGCDVSVSETLCYSLTEDASSVPSESVEPKRFSDVKGESVSKSTKFRVPSIGFSKSEVTSSKIDLESSLQKGDVTLTKYQINLTESESKLASLGDENLSDFEVLGEDGSEEQGGFKLEGKTTSAEISLVDTEVTVKIPKFRKPKFRIRSKGKASEGDIGSNVQSDISKGRISSDMTGPDIEKTAQISDPHLGVKLHKPSLEVVLDAPTVDPNLSPMEATLPNLEAEIRGPDLECKAEQEVATGEKGTEEKENKFKSSKFKLPSFRWSPKKEAIAPSPVEEHLEGPTLSTLSGDMGSELTLPTPENQYTHEEFDTTEKDGEKAKTKKSQFTMPKISFPKIKGQKVQVSLPVLETDVSGPKEEKEAVSVQKSEKGSSGEVAGLGIKVPKVTVPPSEFSKPEAQAPKVEMHISMPTGEVKVPTCEGDDLTLKSAAANASLSTSDIKMTPEGLLEVKSPDISVERKSSEIAVGDVEIKAEGSEAKTKMSKFQMPKVGITLSKGKRLEKDVGQSKSEVKVPQLKATVEISDIAVEAPDLKAECGTEKRIYSPEAKITKTDSKTSEADVHLPSADIPFPKPDSDIQDSDAAVTIKGEIKQDGEGEEKEGHFKMPKFKLPSFSWSPKKEASVKSDSGANLEDQKLAVVSSRIDTEVKETAADDQGSGADLDLEISSGKVEQKSPIKKPQFVMPKISLSKIKVPKSQKVEVDATLPKTEIEGDDSIKIPDIEKSHPEGTEEGAQISIKLADTRVHTLEFSRVETEASKTEITVSSAKIDASLTPSERSFQQVDLKISSANECNIQKTGTKLPKGEASVDLKSPDILTESSSVVDGRKVKLEGPEGKIKMPTFQKTKFGISRIKGKVPETEISSPKIEAELPQLRTTNEIAGIAVGVPASELISDMSDPGGVDGKIKTPQALTGGIEDAKVDISTQSVSKPKTESVSESLEEKEIKLKEHEIKAEEVQTEEHQGWFKMPKFRIPAFGRSSLKEQKSDADIERSMEKAQATIPSAKAQTETSVPENTFSLPHAVAEITIGKEGIQKLEDSVKMSNVSLPEIEGHISLSAERTDSGVSLPKTETYAEVVKRSAEGHTSEITVSTAELSKSYPSASETDKARSSTNRFPTCTLTSPEHKGKSQDINVQKVESSMKLETSGVGCKPSSAEITLDATQKKIDVNLPKEELDIPNKEAAIKKGKIKGEVKITGKDSEESQLKRTVCEWSTTKGSEDGTYVTAKLEDLKVEVPTLKTDVKITGVDPEMKFCVKSVEKDVSAGVEVQVEDRAETSKIKAYKFKIPRFGMLHSEIKGFEDDTSLPKSEADSAPQSERDTAEMQLQKPEGLIGLKSPGLDHKEASARITGETVDQTQGVPEVSVKIPKLKIPRFTFRTLPIEADVLLSKVVTDPKGSSTDIEIVRLQASSAISEETQGAVEGGIQKAKSKILTLTEPDIKTAQMTATIESSLSSAGQDIHWSYIEGQEVSEKVEPEHVAIERCEIYTTEILKESEILSSEVKTAALGFSLLKAKLPESHSDLDVLVQQPSPTGDASVRRPTGAGESFGAAAQRTGSAELKLSDKPHHGSEESRGKVSLSKLKTSAAEVKGSSKLEEGFPGKSPEGITAAPLSEDEDVVEAVEGEEKDITNEKEKTDNKRSPGRFKFWLPSIGFSSPGDETSTDAKAEIKKSVPEDVKPADTSDDSSKQAEKAGWFRFPKLGFTSPSKKAKSVDKEEVGHKEGRLSDEDSPTDKPDVFFDAQESLSPKETGEGEKAETDGASSIVTSSARTELILLEEEKDIKSNIVGDTAK